MLKKTLESPIDCKEIKPVNPKGNQSWIFMEGLTLKLKLQYFDHLMQRADFLEKTPDAGKDWRLEEKETTENEMVGWHHRLNGHEFEWTHGVGDGQGGLACCDSWVAKSRTRLNNWTELNWNQWWEGNGNPLQYCCLENSLDRGAWWAAIHGVAKEMDET